MTTSTQARLSVSKDPHNHVWQIDFEKPSRSRCACGKVRQGKLVPWSDAGDGARRTAARRPPKPAPAPTAGKAPFRWGPKG